MFIAIVTLVSFLVTLLAMSLFIKWYKRRQINGQQMHEDMIQHAAKAGTPTMGGLVFVMVTILISLLVPVVGAVSFTGGAYGVIFTLFLYALIGFLDDGIKIVSQKNEGLKPYQKLFLQLVGAMVFFVIQQKQGTIDASHIGYSALAAIFILFWMIGFSNAVNLTDGIDGLASITVAISLATYAIIAYWQGQIDILVICLVMIASLCAFFMFNHNPAKIFMGDVGSLALGGMLAAISMIVGHPWSLLLVGIVYVLETTSVMIQVVYFKLTKKRYGEGRRIFRMTPFHHHLELGGLSMTKEAAKRWSEWRVDAFLWMVALVGSVCVLLVLWP